MLPRADIAGTRPVVYIEAPSAVVSSTDVHQDSSRLLERISLGQQIQATVQSRVEDGKFLVRIADTMARMSLPVGTQIGDDLSLTLVDTEPRLTFLLGPDGAKGAATATLSTTGRMINNILQTALQDGASTTVIGKTPIVLSAAAASAQIATALSDTLSQSGLFYESHLNDWIDGTRTIKSLLLEPQNKAAGNSDSARLINYAHELAGGRPMAEMMREAQMKPGGDNGAMRLLNAIQEWTDSGRSVTDLMQALRPQGAEATQISPDSARIINQQLDSLERQRFVWQGELWPGQPMEWEVSRDAPDKSAADDAPQSWQSVVRFELPSLGTVAATINLIGDRVHIQMRTTTETAAQSLRAHGKELADAMDAAGSPLDLLTVKLDAEI